MSPVALFCFGLGIGFGLLVVAAALRRHARRMEAYGLGSVIDDSAIDKIIEDGKLAIDEDVLDLDEIDGEENRFWSESWDKPTGYW